MLSESIAHGINLHQQVSLQYLYYLDQVGLSIAPLSNNFLFRKISSSPFVKFFRRGLNVTLSTDDPLLFHMSDDPLLEEYSVARATFDLGLDGTLSEVTAPQDHLCRFDVVGDSKVSDGTSTALGGSSLHGGLWVLVKDLLCGGPGFLHAVGVGDFGTEFQWEFVASGSGDFQSLGARLEFEHGAEGGLVTVFGFDVDLMDATDGSDPL